MYNLHSILIQLKKEDTPLHGVMVRCVRCFYQWLDPTLWEGSALFELWAQELELIYGDLRQRLSPNAKTDAGSLGDRFGFDTPPELPRLLQSIQTFYSVLIKLIAWNTLRGATPEPPLTELLSGRAFVNRGIRNFCGDDWYIWPLDIWDPALETQCEELRACLESFDTCPEGSTLSPDSLSRIYETVVPPALRHALGEYYTPGWLAERTLQNAVSASGRAAGDLRFLEPACRLRCFFDPGSLHDPGGYAPRSSLIRSGGRLRPPPIGSPDGEGQLSGRHSLPATAGSGSVSPRLPL